MVEARDERWLLPEEPMNRKSLLVALCLACGFASVPLVASAQDSYRYENNDYRRDDYRHDRYADAGPRRGMSDTAIQYRVQRALARSMGNDADRIYVRVEDRNVYLSGRVDRPGERFRARQVADDVYGVRNVYADRLRVRRY
jgi:osmotically-inducible protein OsmY